MTWGFFLMFSILEYDDFGTEQTILSRDIEPFLGDRSNDA